MQYGKNFSWIFIGLCFLGGVFLKSTIFAEFVLVQPGTPPATIVLSENHTKGAHLAALELQHYVQKITDVLLAIGTVVDSASGDPIPGPKILVGKSYYTTQLGLDPGTMERQQYLIKTFPDYGGCLVLMGQDEPVLGYYDYSDNGHLANNGIHLWHRWGSAYAVYTFLEKYIGVRWYWPTEEGTVIPMATSLVVPDVSILKKPNWNSCFFNTSGGIMSNMYANPFRPETMIRNDSLCPSGKDTGLYRLRNKDGRQIAWGNHSDLLRSYWIRIDPNDPYGRTFKESHPDWFSNTNYTINDSAQMCLSNSGLRDQVVADIISIFTGNDVVANVGLQLPGFNAVSWQGQLTIPMINLGPDDAAKWCTCAGCQRWINPTAPGDRTHSSYVWDFIRDVAQTVKTQRPDLNIKN